MATRSNGNFQQMKLGTSVLPYFYVIFTGQSISEIILLIQGQKVNLKGNIIF